MADIRTQKEIVARYEAIKDRDMFGFKAEVLLPVLDFEHAKPFLLDEATPEAWPGPQGMDETRAEAVEYLGFAFGKARGHRGTSAARSVEKMGEWLWLLGTDADEFHAAPYPMYGVPQLVVAARLLDADVPKGEDLARMAQGLPCDPDGCMDGCGPR